MISCLIWMNLYVYGWNMSILWSLLKIWTPKNFTTANLKHPVSKSWLRPCTGQKPSWCFTVFCGPLTHLSTTLWVSKWSLFSDHSANTWLNTEQNNSSLTSHLRAANAKIVSLRLRFLEIPHKKIGCPEGFFLRVWVSKKAPRRPSG